MRDAARARKPSRLHGESFGKLVDVVIDPTSRRVTHLVVERDHDPWLGRLVPVELTECGGDAGEAVALRATVEEVRRLPPVHEVAYLRLDGFPVAVARVETDAVTPSVTKDEMAALPPVAVRRRLRPLEHRRPAAVAQRGRRAH